MKMKTSNVFLLCISAAIAVAEAGKLKVDLEDIDIADYDEEHKIDEADEDEVAEAIEEDQEEQDEHEEIGDLDDPLASEPGSGFDENGALQGTPHMTEDELKDLFKKIDLDKNDKVTVDELWQFADERAEKLHRKSYADHQANPDFPFVLETTDAILQKYIDQLPANKSDYTEMAEIEKDIAKQRLKLAAADENHDGKLQEEERYNFDHGTGDAIHLMQANHVVREYDADKDGALCYSEFLKEWHKDFMPEAEYENNTDEDVPKLFHHLDRDGNAKLDPDEFMHYFKNHVVDKRILRELLHKTDSNLDGHLDIHEIVKAEILDPPDEGDEVIHQGKWIFQDWRDQLDHSGEL
eukprot:TRINITY_DN3907_c0_g2_i1.p1 TRINITY_DN3907_c0_g2~~TRINITY_DN3907_c0_g2_i1.p1  ORF type:complete len:352 (+),score=82.54 TRINITY_DN3907_c0_g2_i1:54-1109(+)